MSGLALMLVCWGCASEPYGIEKEALRPAKLGCERFSTLLRGISEGYIAIYNFHVSFRLRQDQVNRVF